MPKSSGETVSADEWNARGNHAKHRSGYYYTQFGLTKGTSSFGNFLQVAVPVYIPEAGTYDRIGIEVTVLATGTWRLGIYDDDGDTGAGPGTLILDAGTVDTGTTGIKEITINQTLQAGHVWLSASWGAVNPTIRSWAAIQSPVLPVEINGFSNMYVNRSGDGGALPNPFSTYNMATSSGGGPVPMFFIRKA